MTGEPSFFARRRAGLEAEREAEKAAALPHDAKIDEQPDYGEMSDAEILGALELPDPETLRKGDNFAAFMAKAVPLHLRNRALRKLWRSDPTLACLDGLNDYDADYLTGSTGQGVIQTSYQVGKGLMAHVEKLSAAAAQDDATLANVPDDDVDTLALSEDLTVADAAVAQTAAPAPDDADDANVAASHPRRMRFAFGDHA
ncbi:DUF3306 domain-containing protein [Loktanella sp. DJP18]|uniref:DUF3306 domain-containing protein n=1 Tax=Loktanella sp. DJP18 TaxID=3409788 RepID=UPI003BB73448